ncbi:MAG: cation diffusion facilitator family transporter [Geminicoccaceae bacterium]|nr:cation diffusion facilitator family transporter [Geminicoccaceae bacterium]
MAKTHDHDHQTGDERRVFFAMLLTGGFMLAEVVGGLIAGSLALLADAGHMLTDTAALALAFAAFRVARRGHDQKRTYGYHRFQVLAAFINGLTLILIVGGIAVEAVRRLAEPVEVEGGLMLVIAVAGLVVNIVAFAVLHRGSSENLNVQGAALHVLGDLLGSLAAIAAALVILWTGWMPIDPLLSILVALLIARSAWFLVRKSGHILLEGAPDWLDVGELRETLVEAVPEVRDVHHVHVWMLTSERPLMTLHAVIEGEADPIRCLQAIQRVLDDRYGIGHATVQIERGGCLDAPVAGD